MMTANDENNLHDETVSEVTKQASLAILAIITNYRSCPNHSIQSIMLSLMLTLRAGMEMSEQDLVVVLEMLRGKTERAAAAWRRAQAEGRDMTPEELGAAANRLT
jgi:hypothetical protein